MKSFKNTCFLYVCVVKSKVEGLCLDKTPSCLLRTGRSIGFGWFMIKFEKHTDEIIEYFGSKGADLKSAIVLVKSDLGRDMVSKDVWVLLTERNLRSLRAL